ncbi:MAG: phosphoesterase, partial [Maribacter sp.]|nr:phosphoesterase [Maribacter sp.]
MRKYYFSLLLLFLSVSCATYKAKYTDVENTNDVPTKKTVSHTFYLIGDAGKSPMGAMNPALKLFKKRLDEADPNSTALFLGDNIYPAGMPDKKNDKAAYQAAKNNLDAQLNTLKDFPGKPIFIPGNHDWYSDG